ncbi:hypothetical protein [Paraburkholderia saeva]|uniref:hypothetical protein n=1 Tax=Paraburkholderia saeva TaxID=2777537 RepID=UPI001DB61877|nr:hypothetical protein [Paraburkholderia saeva]CAG4926268.1 hypothetical protein R70241_05456 [Paraburkholderia saeva]
MFLKELGRLATRLFHSRPSSIQAAIPMETASSSAFALDPMWHGDHWQNLLSSPMDARRYVMEDWSVPDNFGFDELDPVATGAG